MIQVHPLYDTTANIVLYAWKLVYECDRGVRLLFFIDHIFNIQWRI